MSGGGRGQNSNGTNNNNNNNNNLNDNNINNNGEEEQIPVGAMSVLKEIVSDFSDSEIYAALKHSNMDPNDAVYFLLSQDPFHQVKSKREKKKEKDTAATRSRVLNNEVHRAGRGSSDHHGRSVSSQYSGVWHRKDNVSNAYAGSSSSSSGVRGSSINWQPLSHSDCAATEKKISQAPANGVFSSTQVSSAFQSTWSGVPGQVAMADVVRMGRPQNTASALPPHYDEDGASRVAANLQQLSLQNDDQRVAHEEESPPVIIPDHLQVQDQDVSHLSFGRFGAGIDSTLSESFSTNIFKNKLEETSQVVDAASAGLSDARNPDYHVDDFHTSTLDENLMHRTGMSASTYDSIPVHQLEIPRKEIPGPSHESQFEFPSSATGYPYESFQQLNAGFNDTQSSFQMPNVVPFSGAKVNSNLLPSGLLASTAQSGKESDLSCSPFDGMESLATKYSNMALSMSEALRASSISSIQPAQQTPAGANVGPGPTLPRQLSTHPHSQTTFPLGPFANTIGYPSLPESCTHMPSAFQQTFARNSTHQYSLAALLEQYKKSPSVGSLPQSAAVASGYGFGSSSSVPGSNFALNPPTAPTGVTLDYDDLLSSQYEEASHLISSLQRNENPVSWFRDLGSRTMSSVPGSAHYNFQQPNQQRAQLRQAQQQSQQFVPPGYQDYYQKALLLKHQQKNSRDRPF